MMGEVWRTAALELLGQAMPVFLLMLARASGMMGQAPILGAKAVPATGRAALALVLTFAYWSSMPRAPEVPSQLLPFLLALVVEVATGVLFGYAAMVMFQAFQAAGELVAQQTSLSMMTTLNPMLRTQTTAVGNLFFYLAQTALLTLGGHLWLVQGFYQSFEVIPLGGFQLTAEVWEQMGKLVINFFLITIQVAMPATMVMLMVDFGLGILNRAIPTVQNILELVTAVKPSIGFAVIALMTPNVVASVKLWGDKMLRESHATVLMTQPTPEPTPIGGPSRLRPGPPKR
ncbi:MAG: flagellar biosynthetic protein FliR [Candidatus Sericytochromatia bacterium]|nr:flagellar biosynthetic protein FliR [Candidatus Tanganyikabacteria bacterium]